ncbi:pyridoxamine 5'-phosphate oxidase [Nocardioides sp. BE266]|uniref:pyridoxine/pyridoxamine 5'-phosphate oxidase n=1 Tax=Nocardioides sp. BE266 TaxID=2817725 RepID=UPI002860EE15|nr:pyridoxamine 5'-phosphate oxidase family protein [Nocardioides sp. BE266]MDR7251635.1 pyridoxamine 5'-phosphate oxidase [Nocardioides sp. BE266]
MAPPSPGDLRRIPSLTGSAPSIDLHDLPRDPTEMFAAWLDVALDRGVPEPVAATLATVDDDGVPDARTLIIKAVDEHGWAFAGTASSRKGQQLAACPNAALTLWWQPLVRAVRARGAVVEASRDDAAADLAARSEAARTGVDPEDWRLWRLVPSRVEFWQGSPDRRHLRIVYTRDGAGWHLDPG